jgi:hypothetical protein
MDVRFEGQREPLIVIYASKSRFACCAEIGRLDQHFGSSWGNEDHRKGEVISLSGLTNRYSCCSCTSVAGDGERRKGLLVAVREREKERERRRRRRAKV